MGCGGNGDRIALHNAIRDVLFNAAQSAALAPTKEAPNLVPGFSTRPADILLPNWCRGRPATLDVSVISPLQKLTLVEAAFSPGHPNDMTKHLFGRPAIALWRGNAGLWMHRHPSLPPSIDGLV